jgi:hypothetical protein
MVLLPGRAEAHAFGARHDLPLPLWLYLIGAGLAVLLSFLAMIYFMRKPGDPARRWSLVLPKGLNALLTHGLLRLALQAFGVLLFVLILAAGFFGNQSTTENLAPTFVWVIWWVGFAFLQALIGDLWRLINPWNTLFAWAEYLTAKLFGSARLSRALAYPAWLGAWPAVIFFWAYAWFELVPDSSQEPAALALAVSIYSVLTWLGMFCFGRETWLARGEAFSLFFGTFARFAPFFADQDESGHMCLRLRPFGIGLLTEKPLVLSQVAFVVLMLSSVTFDGFTETPPWAAFLHWLTESQALRPLLLEIRAAGFDLYKTIMTLALAAFPLAFLVLYGAFSWATARSAGPNQSAGKAAGAFVLTLVPIAIAYHLAHYLSFLLLAGQLLIPLLSDPFGWGWNLLGLPAFAMDPGLAGPALIWGAAALAIVTGHMMAVYLAHVMALRLYRDKGAALRSQVPMLVLMVFYTMTSLWIMAQPLVKDPTVF